MKKSIFTIMALMATAVCGLTSCNDSDDDYVAPAAAAAGVAPDSLTTGIEATWPGAPQPQTMEVADGFVYQKTGDTTATYTLPGDPAQNMEDSVFYLDFANSVIEMRDEEGNPVSSGTFTVL